MSAKCPPFIEAWLEEVCPAGCPDNLLVLRERSGGRELAEDALKEALIDHFIGIDIVTNIGGFPKAAAVLRNALPINKETRSGDFGEILATEYIDQRTTYSVPVRRLRWKDDRAVPMRGDDVLGFNFGTHPTAVLKAESKSRIRLSSYVVKEACKGLCRYKGRPNPSTLSFISRRLREAGEDDRAAIIEQLQEADIPAELVTHLIF